ncbi:MAG: AAA family ATPase, partial [Clostridia bacterium]|nr:AAA family ATPase [Clostridia bacterium]
VLAGLEYVLAYNATANGHSCLPWEKLSAAAAQLLSISEEQISDMLAAFISDEKLSLYTMASERFVMANSVADDEKYIAKRIAQMQTQINHINVTDIYALIESVEAKYSIRYAQLQKEALFEAISGSLLVLTGGPGTGKTTVVKGLISIFTSLGLKCVLAAPTGRAAKRLSEATGQEAKTIHRLLEMDRGLDGRAHFNRDERNPLSESVIIVDEISMIDLALAASLFRAIKRGARLILIGDADQLPSVGAGNVLDDIISSEKIKTIALTQIFRQSGESLIVTNAHKINEGESPILNDTKNDFFFLNRENERDIANTVADLVLERLPKKYGDRIREGIQIITPSKKGYGGVNVLNQVLQERINPPLKFKKEIKHGDIIFRENDKVMQITNNYDIEWEKNSVVGMGVFNGDIGYIEKIDLEREEMKIRFDDRVATYSFDLCDEIDLAYAITVHKSQGSEYPVVILPMYYCPPMLMTRNLLYTAVTRAKQMVIMVGRSDVPRKMVENNREVMRYTTLAERIKSS